MNTDRRETKLFEQEPVPVAIAHLALPTIVGQIILVIYNMADTFFIGLTGSDAKLASVAVCLPAFMFLSAIANLFGVGGAGESARSLGRSNKKDAGEACAFSFWGCALLTLVYIALAMLLRHPFLNILGGGDPEVHRFATGYLIITVGIGGLGTSMNMVTAHLFRSEGRSMDASIGIVCGSILNILLDPLFMFVLLPPGKEVLGAGIATALSNWIAFAVMIVLQYRRRAHSVLSFRLPAHTDRDMVKRIFGTGLPACIMTLFENISYACLDRLMMANGTAAQAGLGVAKKINLLAHATVRGLTQGVLPLLAYNHASKNFRRMKQAIRDTVLIALAIGLGCMAACLFAARPLVGFFVKPGESLTLGMRFLRILCIGAPFSAVAYTFISFFQAVGRWQRAFVLAVLRKGFLDIPLMFLFCLINPLTGIVAATPTADLVCCMTAFFLYQLYHHRNLRETASM
ncbi:MAG: polysaccharide biosynthesis C-terminal domain-containing protein [Lachnospiraceae bacterium]|nr:polysaccharide biosynthesis C-terminal domain-containing protein [Lachnospiraceae bacterium]